MILTQPMLEVLRVLEEHPSLDHLQIAARAELSVTEATNSVRALAEEHILTDKEGVFSLDRQGFKLFFEKTYQ